MRVLLVSANTEKINMPVLPLGLACVAEATRNAGHDVKLVDLMDQQNTRIVLKDAVDGFQPEVIGISVRNIDNQCMENPRESSGRPLDYWLISDRERAERFFYKFIFVAGVGPR